MHSVLNWIVNAFSSKRQGPVRFMFPVAMGFVAVLGAQLISSTEASYIRIEVDSTTVLSGDRFTVDVYAYAHVPVNAVDVTLTFDADKAKVWEVDRGNSVLTIWTEDPVVTDSSVSLRGGTFRRGFLGEHLIASIDLEALETGNSTFNTKDILLLAGDGSGTKVKTAVADDSSVNLFVYDESVQPGDISVDVEVRIVTDVNGDGSVTLQDVSVFMADWRSRSTLHDFNGDGRMTFKDFSIILADFFLR